MFNPQNAAKLYSISLGEDLPPAAKPYALFLKPLQTFLLASLDVGNPTTFVPAVTIKATFELFLSSYLGDLYNPVGILRENESLRRTQGRGDLAFKTRSVNPSAPQILELPHRSFLGLLKAVLKSESFRLAFRDKITKKFASGEILASESILRPEFLPYVDTISTHRIATLFNAGLKPLADQLPDSLLALADSRFESDPDLSRQTFTRFKPSEHARLYLPELELSSLNREFEHASRAANLETKRQVSRYQAKLGVLLASGVVKANDPEFLDEVALETLRNNVIKSRLQDSSPGNTDLLTAPITE